MFKSLRTGALSAKASTSVRSITDPSSEIAWAAALSSASCSMSAISDSTLSLLSP